MSLLLKAPSLCHGTVEQNEDDPAAGVACLARLFSLDRAEDVVGAEREDEIVADVVSAHRLNPEIQKPGVENIRRRAQSATPPVEG